jgi:hypothetical protein
MGAVLLAFGLVSGIVGLAWNQADDPTIRKFAERRRLTRIARKDDRFITRDEAEDALVLARRHGQKVLAARFTKLVASIKRRSATP